MHKIKERKRKREKKIKIQNLLYNLSEPLEFSKGMSVKENTQTPELFCSFLSNTEGKKSPLNIAQNLQGT